MKRNSVLKICLVVFFSIFIGFLCAPTASAIIIYPGLEESYTTDLTSNDAIVDYFDEVLCPECTDPVRSLYKSETIDEGPGIGTATEYDTAGNLLATFNTLYDFSPNWNTLDDFFGGDITWSGGAYLDPSTFDCLYLIVKDGNQSPGAYAFNLLNLLDNTEGGTSAYGSWNGTDTLALSNFWGGVNGSISHVEIRGYGGPVAVPEPTTMLLTGFGLLGLAGFGRKKFFKK